MSYTNYLTEDGFKPSFNMKMFVKYVKISRVKMFH